MNTKIYSATTIGIDAYIVDVEVDLSYGLINFFIVGLPDIAIKESKQRIQTALKNSGIKIPERKIVVNLAPANLRKEGTLFDLPIAIGILVAFDFLRIDNSFLNETIFIGELSLNGDIKSICGALSIASDIKKLNKKRIILPKSNAQEASLIDGIEIIGVESLKELISFLRGDIEIKPTKYNQFVFENDLNEEKIDFDDVKGQVYAKRALQIAATGNHNIIFIGAPGSGKTMLAKRLFTIMPKMSLEEKIETSKIYSISGKLNRNLLIQDRPFRNPHHTISSAGLIGGGSNPTPGEISLAHNGILFLDELTEFKKYTLEALRQPLETFDVNIVRVNQSIKYPASFLLIAALNPCPCGFYGSNKECVCSENIIKKYNEKISGPLLDRIDIKVNIKAINYSEAINFNNENNFLSSNKLKEGVSNGLEMQKKRFLNEFKRNANMASFEVEKFCILSEESKNLIEIAFDKLKLSMRSYHKILKLSRTIADIDKSELIESKHIKEAILYKS